MASTEDERRTSAAADEPEPEITILPPKPIASLSVSLSSLLSPPPSKPLKIPSQISAVHFSLSLSPLRSRPSLLSTSGAASSSPIPALSPLRPLTRRPSDPSHPVGLRRCSIVWFRSDLRVHDNEALSAANADSLSVLPVYCFDPRDYGRSPSGLDRTGPHRARFLIDSVSDLRRRLRARGSDLVVRIGRPEVVIPEVARAAGADGVYAHLEVSRGEVEAEESVRGAVEGEEGVEVRYFWGSTLYHLEDLPFKLEGLPSNYGGFREKVKGVKVRGTIEALDELKGLPKMGDVEVGEIPSLLDLGLSPVSDGAQDGKSATNANASSLIGGETEALERLKTFAAECRAQPNKDGNQESIYGTNFSCKISPWLAMGCLSPRYVFEELNKSAIRTISAASTNKKSATSAENGMNWLMFELLWRDFFRFITKKYSSSQRKVDAVPATACAGALV
ncbi:Blue-light photoreceptor PHR2 [Acorus calamus]|uniref:Blue-light photoreceptor PHR2 n=1 Tax=Acorus calamus TaxID=4465 RepID=A0AAV9CXF4_ACOCL|nr:Blue-light photoreceptor PHR2 [Acorus calamus]